MTASTIFQLASTIQATIYNNYRFRENYQVPTILNLIEWGHGMGLSDDMIHDFICTGSRRGKFLSIDELKEQVDTYLNTVKPRGFPFGFTSLKDFQAFLDDLHTIFYNWQIPMHDTRIHGSALRTAGARDIDLLTVLRPNEFNDLASRFNQPLKGMDYPGTRKMIRKAKQDPANQTIQEDLNRLSQNHKLEAVDLLVVAEGTYFPNRPYLQCKFTR